MPSAILILQSDPFGEQTECHLFQPLKGHLEKLMGLLLSKTISKTPNVVMSFAGKSYVWLSV